MIDPFTISVLANLATAGGTLALKKILKSDDLENQITQAFDSSLEKWSKNSDIRRKEGFWSSKRLRQLFKYLENPTLDFEFEKPTQELINYFYLELQKKQIAWNFIQGEQFKIEIKKLNSLEKLLEELKNQKLQPGTVRKALNNQVYNQLEKQIVTEKYIPQTFIETDELKDNIRYFVTPYTFYPKLFNETLNMNFNHLNRINKINNRQLFSFDFSKYLLNEEDLNISTINKKIGEAIFYLNEKHEELEKQSTNLSYAFKRKIESKRKSFEFLSYKVLMLNDNAGQGKTNLLCDLIENITSKREIPTIFLSGYEIDANNISESISKRIFPNDNFTLNEILESIENNIGHEHLIIIIDGINENPNPSLFSQNLELFIQSLIEKEFVKIILTCRTEYFKNNFENIINSSYHSRIQLIDGLNSRLNEQHKKRLLETYFHFFDIKIDSISEEIEKQLSNNFLLLRIFSEVNKGKHLPSVTNIFKSNLFIEYYKLKVEQINKRIIDNDDFKIKGKFDIRHFIENIASYMIKYHTFHNIPIDNIINDDNNREIYIRFLDENIILKKDLPQSEDSIFSDSEVINFTYDEFRDFIISDYLINNTFKESKENFEEFISKNLIKASPILEGCSIFLYSLSRKIRNDEIKKIIERQEWYNSAFLSVIFSTPDYEIIDGDKIQLKQIFTSNQSVSEKITLELAYHRYNTNKYQNLNINLLFELFNDLSENEFEELVYSTYKGYNNSIKRLVEQLEKFLEDFDAVYHPLFKYLLYFMPLDYSVKRLYFRYYSSFLSQQHLRDLLKCKNENIVTHISQFIKDYDIQL
ncbi:MAG TPA: hypothetical protein VLZ83_09885 [Edaphocola sp.]|nr:hypothetical protein [Edaphocola sp.]